MYQIVKLQPQDRFCSEVHGAQSLRNAKQSSICSCTNPDLVFDSTKGECLQPEINSDCEQFTDFANECTDCAAGIPSAGICAPLPPERYEDGMPYCPLGYALKDGACSPIQCKAGEVLYGDICYDSRKPIEPTTICARPIQLIDHEDANIQLKEFCLSDGPVAMYFDRSAGIYSVVNCSSVDADRNCECETGSLLLVQNAAARCVEYDVSFGLLAGCEVRVAVASDQGLAVECLRYERASANSTLSTTLIVLYLFIGIFCIVAVVITLLITRERFKKTEHAASFIDYYNAPASELSLTSSQAVLNRESSIYI